jgi:hypothetical protein
MSYKVSKAKYRLRGEKYYSQREINYLKAKQHGKLTIPEYAIEGVKYEFKTGEQIHRRRNFVEYKGKTFIVLKPEKDGIWLIPLKEGGMFESKKPIYVKEKDYLLHASPIYNLTYPQVAEIGGAVEFKP